MISTVTTTTVTTVTAATAAVLVGLSLLPILILLGMLMSKELVSARAGSRFSALSDALNVPIVPLLLGFFLVVVVKIAEVLH